MLKVVKRLKEHFSGKKGTDKINVTIDENTNILMAKLDKIKNAVENIKADATPEVSPTLTAYGLCDAKLPEVEGIELPDHTGFSKSFIAELDKALSNYRQKLVIQHYEHDGKNVPKEIKTGERSITDKDD